MNYYLGGQGSEGQSGPGAVGAVGAGVPGVGVGLGGSLGSHSHSHATSQQQQQQQVQQQQYLMQQHYAAYQAQAHAQANANANQAYQPTTNQERINDVTMTIENPNVVGSGYIRHNNLLLHLALGCSTSRVRVPIISSNVTNIPTTTALEDLLSKGRER